MYYEEIRPHPLIAKYVKLIWIQEFDAPGKSVPIERIVADGIVEVVFHFGDSFITYYADNTIEKQPASFAIAQLNRPIQIQPNGRIGIIAVRFFHWGAYHFFNTPIHEFADKAIDIKYLWQEKGLEVEDRINNARSNKERIDIIETFLIQQLNQNYGKQSTVDPLIRYVQLYKGKLSIDELLEKTGLGERTLERKFRSSVGISPKQLSRLTRFLHSCKCIRQQYLKSLTQIGLECGYHDQAHFIRDFKNFSGLTPKEFRLNLNIHYFDLD